MKYNFISNFNVSNNFSINIEFNGKYNVTYKWVIDITYHKEFELKYPLYIVDMYEYKLISLNQFNDVDKIIWYKYSVDYFRNNILWKYNVLQIEWDLTIYLLYRYKEELI